MFGGKKKENSADVQTRDGGSQSSSELYQNSFSPTSTAQTQTSVSTTVANITTIQTVWTNPIVQNAIHTLATLSELGSALPYISPAFVLVKIIIDIEQKARDVDAKCNDLLERITFMIGHLSLLNDVEMSDMTRNIIDRMNGVLETATALVQAYRKQGPVARRLNTSNRNKFISCVDSINACSNDFMVALQIHQTGQLHVLTRSVPNDLEDEAAQTFISEHGGLDAIKGNKDLVAEFARQVHLNMDDRVMEQINTNLTDLMQENQAKLGLMLKENVGTAVVDGIKELAVKMTEAEKEQTFNCVQCDKEYRNSTNGPASCSFHRAEYSSWTKSYPCCSTSHPCQFRSHRARHHCEYPYGAFFQRSYNIQGYTDTVEKWASVEDIDLETDDTLKASVSQLLRWVSRGDRLDEKTILITVGKVWYNEPYFFDTYNIKELKGVAALVRNTRQTTIFRTSSSDSQFAMAEWILSSEGVITGVRLTAKAASSESPSIKVCPIDVATCAKAGDIVTVSKGGLRYYHPETPYSLPETIRVGPELSEKPLRAIRTDFKTCTSSALQVLLKNVSDPPLKANPKYASEEVDFFEGEIIIFNKHPAGSPNPITIASIAALFRLVGDEEYTPVRSCQIFGGAQLPITIGERQSCSVKFEVAVRRSDRDIGLDVKWWNRAFVSRRRPLRLKVVFQDIEGEECSLVLEHIHHPYFLEKAKPEKLGFFYFDDPELWTRHYVHLENSTVNNNLNGELEAHRLEKIVHQALKTGETEIDLKIGRVNDYGVWEWTAWALVDLSCRRVYAFKVLLQQGRSASKKTFATLGYALCPSYGEPMDETRPIRYATETNRMPELEPFIDEEIILDDSVDDVVPEVPKPALVAAEQTAASSVSQIGVPENVTRHLASIDESLSRIATSLERLVDVFGKTGNA